MAGLPSNYRGQGFSLIGDKNRFVLPSDFRGTVREASGGQRVLCLDKHHKYRCLVGFGLARSESFAAMIDREEAKAIALGHDYDRDERGGQLFAFDEAGFDESGRFILAESLAEQAGVTSALYFHGGGEFFTIWAPDMLFAMGEGWDGAKAKCRAHMAEAAARPKRK